MTDPEPIQGEVPGIDLVHLRRAIAWGGLQPPLGVYTVQITPYARMMADNHLEQLLREPPPWMKYHGLDDHVGHIHVAPADPRGRHLRVVTPKRRRDDALALTLFSLFLLAVVVALIMLVAP